MYVTVYNGYGEAERMSQEAPLPATQVAATQSSRGDHIAVIGVTLAFFSTLMIFANIMAQGDRR